MYTYKKISKYVVAMMATIAMVFTMMPMSVKANTATNTVTVGGTTATTGYENADAETLQRAFDNYNTADSQIILGDDIIVAAVPNVPIVPVLIDDAGVYNLDLNGHKITYNSYIAFLKVIPGVDADVIICDNSTSKTGEIKTASSNSLLQNYGIGNFTLQDGTYTNSYPTGNVYINLNSETVTVQGNAKLQSEGTTLLINSNAFISLKGNAEITSNSSYGAVVFNTARTTKSIEVLAGAKIINNSGGYDVRFSVGATRDTVSNLFTLNSSAMSSIKTYPALTPKRTIPLNLNNFDGTSTVEGIAPVSGVYTNASEGWIYDATANILTLNDVCFDVATGNAITTSNATTSIYVMGNDNVITSYGATDGIHANGDLNIMKSGELTINNNVGGTSSQNNAGIFVNGKLIIGGISDEVSVTVKGGNGFGVKSSAQTILSCELLAIQVASGSTALSGGASLTLNDMDAYSNSEGEYIGITHIQNGIVYDGETGSVPANDIRIMPHFDKYDYTGTEAAAPSNIPVSKSTTDIELNPVIVDGEVVEYAVSTSPTAPTTGWQKSTIFSNLTPNTEYYFFARVRANQYFKSGVASTGVMIKTDKNGSGGTGGTTGTGGVNTGDTTNTSLNSTMLLLSGSVMLFYVFKRKSLLDIHK